MTSIGIVRSWEEMAKDRPVDKTGLLSRVSELEAELAQARRLLRELWNDTGALSAGASSDVAERVSDELNKE